MTKLIEKAPLAFAVAVVISAASSFSAQARIVQEEYQPQNDTCYTVNYRQQIDAVNTRGRLARREYHELEFNPARGVARSVYTPPVFIETRRVVEPEHYSLSPVRCGDLRPR